MIRFFHFFTLSALLACTTLSHAQNANRADAVDSAAVPPNARARDLPTPARPSIPSARVTPVEPELEEPETIIGELILVDDSADQVLKLLEQMTDKIILRRQDLPVTKITFDSRGSLTKREAVLALESLLTLNGVMLTDMGGRFMKAVPATNVNTHVPQMLAGSTLGLDPSQQIYAKLFKLDYLNAEQAAAPLIQPLLSQNSSVIPFPKSNALLITDALINLQRIESILSDTDRPQVVREELKFIKLDFVQATEMQDRIENLIQGPLKSYLEGNTSVTADERTNQLILITHPGNIDIIMQVIESVDVDAAPLTSSEVFQLRQAKAEEVVPIIEDIISGQKEGREEDAQVARENEQANNPGNNNTPNLPGVTVNTPTTAANIVESNSSLQFSNFVGLSADERTNSIVAYGTQQDLETLKDLIDKIDIPLPQVRIEAIITEVSLGATQASGLSSLTAYYNDGAQATSGTGTASNSIGPIAGRADQSGLLTFGLGSLTASGAQFGNFALDAVLNIAESDSDVKILSAPTIVISHNEEGVINVSQSRPFQTSSVQDSSSTSFIRDQVEYRDVGIKLTVTPLIGVDGSVTMQIEQTVDTVQSEGNTTDGSVSTRPIIGKREANSTITVQDKEVIILGGLQENKKDVTQTYFPLIGRIPYIKEILSGEDVNYTRTELIIFIRPTILRTPKEANSMSQAKIDVIAEGEAVRKYLEDGSTGDVYMDGSGLLEKEIKEPKQEGSKPFIKINWPNKR